MGDQETMKTGRSRFARLSRNPLFNVLVAAAITALLVTPLSTRIQEKKLKAESRQIKVLEIWKAVARINASVSSFLTRLEMINKMDVLEEDAAMRRGRIVSLQDAYVDIDSFVWWWAEEFVFESAHLGHIDSASDEYKELKSLAKELEENIEESVEALSEPWKEIRKPGYGDGDTRTAVDSLIQDCESELTRLRNERRQIATKMTRHFDRP